MDNVMIIGVYGLMASGKTTIASSLASEINALYISADSLGHEALFHLKDAIISLFGNSICAEDGNIDRRSLAKIVFSNKQKLKILESVSHPFILSSIKSIIKNEIYESEKEKRATRDIIIEAALLHRIGINKICNITICVDSKTQTLIKRLKKKGLTEKEARKRLKMQRDVKIKVYHADILVKNTFSICRLIAISKDIGRYYESYCKCKGRRRRVFR